MGEVSLVKIDWAKNGRSRAFHGAAAEHAAAAKLMEAGYDVYIPPYPAPYDLIAQQGDQFFRVEVKALSEPGRGSYAPSVPWPKRNQDSWDLLLIVGPDFEVFCFDNKTTREEARDKIRVHYGFLAIGDCNYLSVETRKARNEEICRLFREGKSPEELADQFSLTVRTISDILRT